MSKPETLRAFIAIAIGEEVRRAVADIQNTLRRRGIALRWVAPENLHFTLKFLGEIDREMVPRLGEGLLELAAGTAPFELELEGLGAFPHLRKPRVLWVGLRQGGQRLSEVAVQVGDLVKAFPIPTDDKSFRPHLTLARVKERKPRPIKLSEKLLQVNLGSFRCEGIILMESRLLPGGPKYTPLIQAPFRGESSRL